MYCPRLPSCSLFLHHRSSTEASCDKFVKGARQLIPLWLSGRWLFDVHIPSLLGLAPGIPKSPPTRKERTPKDIAAAKGESKSAKRRNHLNFRNLYGGSRSSSRSRDTGKLIISGKLVDKWTAMIVFEELLKKMLQTVQCQMKSRSQSRLWAFTFLIKHYKNSLKIFKKKILL